MRPDSSTDGRRVVRERGAPPDRNGLRTNGGVVRAMQREEGGQEGRWGVRWERGGARRRSRAATCVGDAAGDASVYLLEEERLERRAPCEFGWKLGEQVAARVQDLGAADRDVGPRDEVIARRGESDGGGADDHAACQAYTSRHTRTGAGASNESVAQRRARMCAQSCAKTNDERAIAISGPAPAPPASRDPPPPRAAPRARGGPKAAAQRSCWRRS